jgi:hypothetical protein
LPSLLSPSPPLLSIHMVPAHYLLPNPCPLPSQVLASWSLLSKRRPCRREARLRPLRAAALARDQDNVMDACSSALDDQAEPPTRPHIVSRVSDVVDCPSISTHRPRRGPSVPALRFPWPRPRSGAPPTHPRHLGEQLLALLSPHSSAIAPELPAVSSPSPRRRRR